MTKILYVTASARQNGSLSRMLGDRFVTGWMRHDDLGEVVHRNVGMDPPAIISDDWIAAAFTPKATRTDSQQKLLELSDRLITEVRRADLIVIATPMYNYGMPGALKAWVDQVVRVNETFTFDLARGDYPLEPVLSGKTLVLLTSSGEFGFGHGEAREEMGHLIPHLKTVSKYLGAKWIHSVSIEYQEFGDARHDQSIATAKEQVDELLRSFASDKARVSA
ncbi:MAG: NAD(P)H-dependent oxidoreductase [Rhodobacteraceae bacterium]|uniref:FMN-dependent NADH-azoreductase n=1 Tax=Marivita sp. TaxID=2003365 RepID=UPI003B51C1FF|nr:NAD(P)H-dependent oxidoreductase [Paracoccaceae bacterium]